MPDGDIAVERTTGLTDTIDATERSDLTKWGLCPRLSKVLVGTASPAGVAVWRL